MAKDQVSEWVKFDFQQARAKHLLFKSRLRSLLYGASVDEAPVLSHHECSVGKWIYNHALEAYAHVPEMLHLEKVHEELHTVARHLVDLYKADKVDEARKGLEHLESTADQLVSIISIVESKVHEGDTDHLVKATGLEPSQINLQELQELQRLNLELDIRIREQSKELVEAQERFKLVAKATQDAIWDWNLITNELWWNEGFKELFGYKQEDIEPSVDSWYSRVHTDDVKWVTENIHEVIDKGATNWSAEYRFRKADGSYAVVFDRGYALHDEQGKAYRMVGSMQDISQRKENEELQKQNDKNLNERFRIMADDSPMFVFIIEPDPRAPVSYWNKTWLKYTGQSFEEAIGRAWNGIIHPDDIPAVMMHYMPAFEKRQEYYMPAVRVKRHDGIYKWHSFKGNPQWLPNGDFNGFVGVGFDIHEQKLAEEALKLSEVQLQQKVAERTTELEITVNELKIANSNLEDFAYAASHDLKEPIRKIDVFSSRIMSSMSDRMTNDELSYFKRMEKATFRMNRLIDDLLLYSQTTNGIAEVQPVNLEEVLNLIIEDLELEIEDKNATIKADTLPVINGNSQQMQQVFHNLISNSLKYSLPELSPILHITYQHVSSEAFKNKLVINTAENYHLIKVKDNGIGFEQQYADRIFNVFTRLQSHGAYSGSGVGLSIVKKVIENHQGYIWAESEPGKGSTFFILLPAVVFQSSLVTSHTSDVE